MPGITNNTIAELRDRVARFDQSYVDDWNNWLNTPPQNRPVQLGIILRRWQACRPNRMRRTINENMHAAPFLDDLVQDAMPHIQILYSFDMRLNNSFTPNAINALNELWKIFENLSYHGHARNGKAGVVGISKAILLLSDGRVGPAFDSKVRHHLSLDNINKCSQWIEALRVVCDDIHAFEKANQTTIALSVPKFAHLNTGRIYDMALGPGI